jgi:hypothetical protein
MTKIKTYKAVKNLLGKSNAKTIKGESKGVTTYILYLAPHTQNKYKINLCPFASKGCALACLYTSGRGKFSNVQEARQNKTTYYLEDKIKFIEQLDRELTKIEAKHKKDGSKFAVRLNGTSDVNFRGLLSRFPKVTFYDYTKNLNKAINNNLANYDLTFSASESNHQEVVEAISKGVKVAIVTSFDISEIVGKTYKGKTFVNGDETDLRFLDPKGSIVLLSAKGEAKKDTDGFVYHTIESVKALIDIDPSMTDKNFKLASTKDLQALGLNDTALALLMCVTNSKNQVCQGRAKAILGNELTIDQKHSLMQNDGGFMSACYSGNIELAMRRADYNNTHALANLGTALYYFKSYEDMAHLSFYSQNL